MGQTTSETLTALYTTSLSLRVHLPLDYNACTGGLPLVYMTPPGPQSCTKPCAVQENRLHRALQVPGAVACVPHSWWHLTAHQPANFI